MYSVRNIRVRYLGIMYIGIRHIGVRNKSKVHKSTYMGNSINFIIIIILLYI